MKRFRLSRSGGRLRETRLDSQREGYIDSVEFTSPIVREHSMLAHADPLGTHKCKMTLMKSRNVDARFDYYFIEWEIPTLDEYVEIGIMTKTGTKKVVDIDGVFELPREAVALLKKNGFNVRDVVVEEDLPRLD